MEQPILMIFVIFFNVLVFLTMVRCSHAVPVYIPCQGKNVDIIV